MAETDRYRRRRLPGGRRRWRAMGGEHGALPCAFFGCGVRGCWFVAGSVQARVGMDLSFGRASSACERAVTMRTNITPFYKKLYQCLRISTSCNVILQWLRHEQSDRTALNRVALANALVLERLADVGTGRGERKKILPLKGILGGLHSCLTCLHQVLVEFRGHEPNYYGIFQESFYLNDLCNLEDRLLRVLNIMGEMPRYEADGMERPRQLLQFSSGCTFTNVLTELFWTKYFGFSANKADVDGFNDAFQREFGTQSPDHLALLRSALLGGKSPEEFDDPADAITAAALDEFAGFEVCGNALFLRFQNLTRPATSVFLMGIIDSEADSRATEDAQDDVNAKLDGENASLHLLASFKVGSFGKIEVKQVCCGGQHAAVLATSGTVYTWGKGTFGRLGHGNNASIVEPKIVDALGHEEVVQVACGFAYSAAVTRNGEVYAWGAGESGRLGLGSTRDCLRPEKVPCLADEHVISAYAGSVHTCLLTLSGAIYSFGKHEYVGHGKTEDSLYPERIEAFRYIAMKMVGVGPGGYHTIALCRDGVVYTWGHNRVGQLGRNSVGVPTSPRSAGPAGDGESAINTLHNAEGAKYSPLPAAVTFFGLEGIDVDQVYAGWGHSAVLTTGGELYVCGRNVKGPLGLGDPENFEKNERGHAHCPTFELVGALRGKTVVHVACGGEHTAVICASGDVYTFGDGSKGQLGHGGYNDEFKPRLLVCVRDENLRGTQITCGNEATILLCERSEPKSLFHACIDTIVSNPNLRKALMRQRGDFPNHIIKSFRERDPACDDEVKYFESTAEDRLMSRRPSSSISLNSDYALDPDADFKLTSYRKKK